MANVHTEQTIIDGDRNVYIVCTGSLDTSDLALTTLVDPANFSPLPTAFRVDEIEFACADTLKVNLYFDATADVPLAFLSGRGEIDFCEAGGYPDPLATGWTGKILISTLGWAAAAVLTYTITLKLTKMGVTA